MNKLHYSTLPLLFSILFLAGCVPRSKSDSSQSATPPVADSTVRYQPTLVPGSVAPDFQLPDSTGTLVHLSDFKGQWVVIDFWASWCGDCRADLPTLKALHNRYSSDGIRFVSISFDTNPDQWKNYLRQQNLPWPQLCSFVPWRDKLADGTQKVHPVAEAYGLKWIPTLFLITPQGLVSRTTITSKEMDEEIIDILYSTTR